MRKVVKSEKDMNSKGKPVNKTVLWTDLIRLQSFFAVETCCRVLNETSVKTFDETVYEQRNAIQKNNRNIDFAWESSASAAVRIILIEKLTAEHQVSAIFDWIFIFSSILVFFSMKFHLRFQFHISI